MAAQINFPKHKYFFLYFGILFALGLPSFLFYAKTNAIPATTIFDLLVLFSILLTRPVFKGFDSVALFFGFFTYILISALYSMAFNGDHVLDFILAYKSYFYLLLLILFFKKNVFNDRHIEIIFRLLLVLFLLKYSISVFSGLNGRPWVYRENNFELMFLALVLLLKNSLVGNVRLIEWGAIISIFVMSGSKSALPIFIVVSASIFFSVFTLNRLFFGGISILGVGVAFIALMFRKISQTGIDGIDRLAFFRVFWREMLDSSFLEILLGHGRLTPLLDSSCQSLIFYQGLFSFQNNGSCYSPVLHTFIFRNIFDHGILGTICVIWVTYYLLIKSGFSSKVAFVFNLVMLLNGLSVSAYNSGFFALAMILFLGSWRSNFTVCVK